jgi:ATP-binding cassette subfamily B protein
MTSADAANLEGYLDLEDREKKKIPASSLFQLGKRLGIVILKYPKPLLLGLLTIGLSTGAALLEPRIFGLAIDEAILPGRWDLLRWIGLGFLCTVSLRIFATIQQSYRFEVLGQRVTQDLRLELFSHLERLSTQVHARHPAGRLLTRVTNDIAALNEMFSAGLVAILYHALSILGILVGLLILDLRLGLIALSVFPFLMALSIYFSRKLRTAYQDSRSKLSAVNAFLAENLAGMKTVHLFNRQHVNFDRFSRLNHWYAEAQTSSVRVYALFQPSITIASGLSIALVIWFGGREALAGHFKLGVLVTYLSYLMSFFQPVRELADKWNVLLSGMTAAERIFTVLDWPVEIEAPEIHRRARSLPELRGHIQFENVWFAYQGENWVLKDFSVEIHPGERVGVVGYTGSGKTTLVSLLMRFYEPQRGRILLDGRDLRSYDLRSLRRSLGLVQQDGFLFSGSFEENIHFWQNPAELSAARLLSEPELLAFLNSPELKERRILEKGVNLSAGERQMVAFARVLAADPKIWILDEATAHMDSKTEQVLQTAVEAASRGKTSIFIAHRLATVRNVDRILVLNHGYLVEAGGHQDLLDRNGLYSNFHRFQVLS